MANVRPRILIRASTAGHLFARFVQQNLDPYFADCTVSSQVLFGAPGVTTEMLEQVVNEFDFLVFIFAPEDIAGLGRGMYPGLRDNTLFEASMYLGRYGRGRTFAVVPSGSTEPRLPADQLGMTLAYYHPQRLVDNPQAACGLASARIQSAIEAHPSYQRRFLFSVSRQRMQIPNGFGLLVEVANDAGADAVLTAGRFRYTGRLRPEVRLTAAAGTAGTAAVLEMELRLRGASGHTEARSLLPVGKTAATWVPLDPNQSDADVDAAVQAAAVGEWHFTATWLTTPPVVRRYAERI